jgi:hypothetical protein
MLAAAVLNTAVRMINDEHTRRSACRRRAQRGTPLGIVDGAQQRTATRAHASTPYQAVGVSPSAMAAADAGLANVLDRQQQVSLLSRYRKPNRL